MSAERLRRAVLVLLGADHEEEDARDFAGLEADNDELVEQVRALEEKLAHEKACVKQAVGARDGAQAELKSARTTANMEREARLAAERLLKSATKVEHESAVGALHAILGEIDKRLPAKHLLCEDDRDPIRLVLRTLRNLATRGLQNDPVFMRDAKQAVSDTVKQAQEARAAHHFAAHYRKAIAEAARVTEHALRAVKELETAPPQDLVERARAFGITPLDGEEFEAFQRRVRGYFPPAVSR